MKSNRVLFVLKKQKETVRKLQVQVGHLHGRN